MELRNQKYEILDVTFHQTEHKSEIISSDKQEMFIRPASTFPSLQLPSPGIYLRPREAKVPISTAEAVRSVSPPGICCLRSWPSGTA